MSNNSKLGDFLFLRYSRKTFTPRELLKQFGFVDESTWEGASLAEKKATFEKAYSSGAFTKIENALKFQKLFLEAKDKYCFVA